MNWLKTLENWNCSGFIANCKKRKNISRFIFTNKEHNMHENTPMHIHCDNEDELEKVSGYQNLVIERENRMLNYGYFTREEIIAKRSKQIQDLLNCEVMIDESIYKQRKKNNCELALGFWDYKKIDFSVLKKHQPKEQENT